MKKRNKARFELLDVADHTFYHFNVNAAYFEQLLNSWSSFMVEQGLWEYNEGMDAGLEGADPGRYESQLVAAAGAGRASVRPPETRRSCDSE